MSLNHFSSDFQPLFTNEVINYDGVHFAVGDDSSHNDVDDDNGDVLNVSHPNSPYGLIHDVLPAGRKKPPKVR